MLLLASNVAKSACAKIGGTKLNTNENYLPFTCIESNANRTRQSFLNIKNCRDKEKDLLFCQNK